MTSNRVDWLIAIAVLGLAIFVIGVGFIFGEPLFHHTHLYWVN